MLRFKEKKHIILVRKGDLIVIVDFKFKNFKNFKKETNFSFKRGKKTELQEHIIKNSGYELLPIKAIYGSNSVGKTNILNAFRLLKRMIVNGVIRKQGNDYIGLCSNFDSKKDYESPMDFDITFIVDKDVYNYKLYIKNYAEMKSEVLYESLTENNEIIFQRTKNDVIFSNKKEIIEKYYAQLSKKSVLEANQELLRKNILATSIFTSWLQTFSGDICQKIRKFFLEKVVIIQDLEKERIDVPIELKKDAPEKSKFTSLLINKLLRELNQEKVDIYFQKEEDNKPTKTMAKYTFSDVNNSIESNADLTESKGTLKLIDLIGLIVGSLTFGDILMVDELDASIHHEIICSIIKAYGDPDINKNGAQLVFTTHNPVYMNEKLLRRDEIVFVEKEVEKDIESSVIHTLDDYDIRKDKKYLKNYLAGEFTMLPNFDLGELIGDEQS